jgi:hypothetical protein
MSCLTVRIICLNTNKVREDLCKYSWVRKYTILTESPLKSTVKYFPIWFPFHFIPFFIYFIHLPSFLLSPFKHCVKLRFSLEMTYFRTWAATSISIRTSIWKFLRLVNDIRTHKYCINPVIKRLLWYLCVFTHPPVSHSNKPTLSMFF